MAEAVNTPVLTCVECGTLFTAGHAAGRPRLRCLTCSPARAYTPKVRCLEHRVGVCVDCSASIDARSTRGPVPSRCSPCAQRRDAASKSNHRPGPSSICEGCSVSFIPKRADRLRFCSRECAFNNPDRWKAKRDRHVWPSTKVSFPTCGVCASPFASRRSAARYCSDVCEARSRRPAERACLHCGASFHPSHGNERTCSASCRKALKKSYPSYRACKGVQRQARKLRLRTLVVEPVDPIKVLQRDGWKCQVCDVPTPMSLRGSHHDCAPEVDHIVPISRGGEHSYRNTRCLCRRCNSAKLDRLDGEWLTAA